jgi:hypothetical protein
MHWSKIRVCKSIIEDGLDAVLEVPNDGAVDLLLGHRAALAPWPLLSRFDAAKAVLAQRSFQERPQAADAIAARGFELQEENAAVGNLGWNVQTHAVGRAGPQVTLLGAADPAADRQETARSSKLVARWRSLA